MRLLTTQPTTSGPAELFTDDVRLDVVARGDEGVADARQPGPRHALRRHGVAQPQLGQTLHATDGPSVVLTRDRVVVTRPADTVPTPLGQEHRRGALPEHFMDHLAMREDDDATWRACVTDDEPAATSGVATATTTTTTTTGA